MSTDTTEQPKGIGVETVDIDHSPTTISSVIAVVAALLAALTSGLFALLSLPLAFGGIAIVASGLYLTPNRGRITIGAASLLLAIVIAGGFGAPFEFLLVSMVATVIAWDAGQNAISLGRQIGSHSSTERNEIVHLAMTTIVATLSGALGYVVFSVAGGGRPVAALTLLLAAIVFFAWAIRE